MAEPLLELESEIGVVDQLDEMLSMDAESIAVQRALFLTSLTGGLLKFAETVFPDASPNDIYGEVIEREPEGRGAHFDVYDDTLDERYPWLGIYNLEGRALVQAALLPEDLAKSYNDRFSGQIGEAAYAARRDFSSIALKSPDVEVREGALEAGMGMVLYQRVGMYVVHNVAPKDADNPGKFVKLAHPAGNERGEEMLGKTNMVRLDELVTRGVKRLSELPPVVESDFESTGIAQELPDLSTIGDRMRDVSHDTPKPPCTGFD